MKVSVQEKVAELERRIVALEDAAKKTATTTAARTVRTTTTTVAAPDLDAEMSGVWKAFDVLFEKAFRWTK